MDDALFAVIMAGGRGERFWPLSREARPKQFLKLLSDHALIRECYLRVRQLIPAENVMVVTSRRYLQLCRENLPELPEENLIGEPLGRNTAACAALAAGIVKRRAGKDAVILTMPSDHVIENTEAFQRQMEASAQFVRAHGGLMTFGIVPTYPATGFGYIRSGKVVGETGSILFRAVASFHEKPSLAVAQEYLAGGQYLWNSGIFVWPVAQLEREFARYAPEFSVFLEKTAKTPPEELNEMLTGEYPDLPSNSIDRAVFEKSDAARLSPAVFDWDDVGGFANLKRHLPTDADGNARRGRVLFADAENSLGIADDKHTVIVAGLNKISVVQDGSVVLVAPLEYAEKARAVIDQVRREHPELL
ncbi:MAG: sugar phosphate nucleotidyltransferase [Victivallaceae bacterium]|nr:sugar phosphate nucleotidyltransferase [Victivallaceae bacterium]